jgi:hypothetical protein
VVFAEGIGVSWPFEIGNHVYQDAHRATMRAVFFQRRGIEKQVYEFNRVYPRSHHPETNKFVYGAVTGEGAKIDNPRPVTGIWGWYADAGDWDGYTSHYSVPYVLMLTHDIRPSTSAMAITTTRGGSVRPIRGPRGQVRPARYSR